MKEALKDTAPENFTAPEEIITGKPILDGQQTAEIKVKIDTLSGKLATQYTPEATIKELTFKEIHDILYYLDKDDPRGEKPKNPENDPQFKSWEEAVARWAKEQGLESNENIQIPADYDNIHLEADQPSLIIITPLPGQKIEGGQLLVDITASARRGIKKVEYYIDDKLIITKEDVSDTNINLTNLVGGTYNLIIKVKDDLENTAIKSVDFKI